MLNNLFVPYYRLSRESKNGNNLGLEVQQDLIAAYVNRIPEGKLLQEFQEVETGTRKGKRPQLRAALQLCKETGATLVIAKLDRLARNVAFIANLMEANVDFVALDIPNASKLTLHIYAAMAEFEADRISQRTKEALARLKAQGKQLGNPQNLVPQYKAFGRENAALNRKQDAQMFADRLFPMINRLRMAKYSLSGVAKHLNEAKIASSTGKMGVWDARKVQNVLNWALLPGFSL